MAKIDETPLENDGQKNIEEHAGKEGAEVVRDESGEILYVRMPPEHEKDELHPDQVVDYQPKFDRSGPQRRVLMFVTDEVDSEVYGPRNSVASIAVGMARDPHSSHITAPSLTELRVRGLEVQLGETAEQQVEKTLGQLEAAGLVEQRDDGTYVVTDEGLVELRN